jgi:photosystem II stability/assembly factor-like uncharacterized protein
MTPHFWWRLAGCVAFGCAAPRAEPPPAGTWQIVSQNETAALLSVSGTSADDVWMVGADDGSGPLVLHGNGLDWQREQVGVRADLWWVQALPGGAVYLAGSNGSVLERRGTEWLHMQTPALADATVFGVWSPGAGELYAVGAAQESRGFLWHYDGSSWRELPLPLDAGASPASLFKVWGASASDVWVVGDRGLVLRGNAGAGFRRVDSGSDQERLFTVHGAAGEVAMVGGSANGWALEAEGEKLVTISPPGAAPLQGVCVSERGDVWAVGVAGNVYARAAGASEWRDVFTRHPVQSLHAVWLDPSGGVWAVGGNVLTDELDHGLALHYAEP